MVIFQNEYIESMALTATGEADEGRGFTALEGVFKMFSIWF